MRQFGLITVLLLCGLVFPGAARGQDTAEVFGGYSYMHQSTVYNQTLLRPGINCPIQNTGSKAASRAFRQV